MSDSLGTATRMSAIVRICRLTGFTLSQNGWKLSLGWSEGPKNVTELPFATLSRTRTPNCPFLSVGLCY